MPEQDRPPEQPDFEDFLAATLKVDPKGLSGKHRREQETDPELSDEAGS